MTSGEFARPSGSWVWIRSAREARWHIVHATTQTWSVEALCGHTVPGPMHRKGMNPYSTATSRQLCAGCVHSLRCLERYAEQWLRDANPAWPTDDPCAETATIRMPMYREALEAAAAYNQGSSENGAQHSSRASVYGNPGDLRK